jgi:hypothetical protein
MTKTVHRRTLQKVKDLTVGDTTVILNSVQKHVMQRALEPDPDRRHDVLHPSDMSKPEWCWRADYYRIRGVPVDPKSASPSFFMETIFEEGHGIHRKWQGWLAEMGWLYGVWWCRECHERWWDTSPPSCPWCGNQRRPKYQEVPLEAPELWIAGKGDGLIAKPGEPLRLLEVKSISLGTLRFEAPTLWDMYNNNVPLVKIWQEIKRPFPSHARQGMTYMYLANRGASDLYVPEMVFLYEWKPTQAVKEFVVKFQPRYIERILAGAQMVTDALETGRAPKRPHWADDEDSKYCTSCPYRSTCWKLDDQRQREDAAPEERKAIPVKRAAANVRRRAFERSA